MSSASSSLDTGTVESVQGRDPTPKRYRDRAALIQAALGLVVVVVLVIAALSGAEDLVVGVVIGVLLCMAGSDTHARALHIMSRRSRRWRDARAGRRA